MKWFGLDINKFCGVEITSTPKILPVFTVNIQRPNRVFRAFYDNVGIENFAVKINKPGKVFKAVQDSFEYEAFVMKLDKPKKQFRAIFYIKED